MFSLLGESVEYGRPCWFEENLARTPSIYVYYAR